MSEPNFMHGIGQAFACGGQHTRRTFSDIKPSLGQYTPKKEAADKPPLFRDLAFH